MSLWHYLITNENFNTAVVGVAASFAGAWGAQIAIFRRDQRREIVATLKSVNEAQTLCSTIGNTLMAMKSQHLLTMMEKFRALEVEYASLQTRNSTTGQPAILNFAPNLVTLPVVKVPVERLEKTVFERLDIRMEALAATIELGKAFDLLNTSLIGRNDILAKWADGPKARDDEVMYRYLGIHRPDQADTKYKDFLFAIEKYCDDCIYFDTMVSEAICEYGQKLRRKYRHHIFWRLPKVSVPDFSKAKELGLIRTGRNTSVGISDSNGFLTGTNRSKPSSAGRRNLLLPIPTKILNGNWHSAAITSVSGLRSDTADARTVPTVIEQETTKGLMGTFGWAEIAIHRPRSIAGPSKGSATDALMMI